MAQIQVQKALKKTLRGPPHQPQPFSTKPTPLGRPFVSGEVKYDDRIETSTATATVTGITENNSSSSNTTVESFRVHVEYSVIQRAVAKRRKAGMTIKTAATTTAQEIISRTMLRRLHDTCRPGSSYSDSQQHRTTAGGKKRQNPARVAYDPLQSHTNQLLLPVVAGVPPATAANTNSNNPEGLSKEQQGYRDRLEKERSEREGSFYVELTPHERQLAASAAYASSTGASAAGRIRYLKEPLPWEGLEDEGEGWEVDQDGLDGNGIDSEDENSLGWSYSPWGGEFRYEISSPEGDAKDEGDEFYYEEEEEGGEGGANRKTRLAVSSRRQQQKDKVSAMAAVDNDDGSSVVEEQDYSRLELTTQPSQNSHKEDMDKDTVAQAKEKTQTLKMEESGVSGESVTTQDPNVIDNTQEAAVDSQVWDAEGAAQHKSSTGGDVNTQEYAQAPISGSVNTVAMQKEKEKEVEDMHAPGGGRSVSAEPIGPQTILMAMGRSVGEEVETLDQIDLLGHEAEIEWLQEQDKIQHAWSVKHHHRPSGGYEDVYGNEGEPYGYEEVADELPLDNPNWHKKHGGLNPKHSRIYKSQHNPDNYNTNRAERPQDRDEDGTTFPHAYSKDPYSAIVYPTTLKDPLSPLGYVAYNRQGDRIMDFSMVGWNEGNTELPDAIKDVPVVERLFPRPGADNDTDTGDDTERIQKALDRVGQKAKLGVVQGKTVVPTGALALARGVYRISKPLKVRDSGVLFRGDPAGGSRIVCQWESTGPRYAIEIEGQKDKMLHDTRVPVVSDYTPVGSFILALDPTYFPESTLAVGDQIMVTRIGNDRWVEDIGMDDFDSDKKGVKPWKKMSAHMFRTIRSLDPHTGIVQLDAPLPISIRRYYGGGWVTKYEDRKIWAVGVQFLDLVFPKNIGRTTEDMLDEKGRGSEDYRFSYEIFANYALRLDLAAHVYFSHITTAFFHNFISVGTDVHHVTLDSVVHSYPDDMLSGQSAFQLSGQLVLIKNSLSQGSFHFFVDINHVPGPNVVHRSQAINIGKSYQPLPLDFAPGEVGPHMKFCTGLLFDQVTTDGSIQIVNRGDMGTGQGYSGANSVVWNSRAREGVLTHRAQGFQNFVIGSEDYEAEDRRPWDSQGWKEHLGSEVLPGSLYLRQLTDR
ncbi:hypothetical protein BGZ89_002768, partial [Linnemannia elongata]